MLIDLVAAGPRLRAKRVKLVRARRDAKCGRIWKREKTRIRLQETMSRELATSLRYLMLCIHTCDAYVASTVKLKLAMQAQLRALCMHFVV